MQTKPSRRALPASASALAFSLAFTPVLSGCSDDDGVPKTGDADTNPACTLLAIADVEEILVQDEELVVINGKVVSGQFAARGHACKWITNVDYAPWTVKIHLEEDLGDARQSALDSIQETLDVYDEEPNGLGDLGATRPGGTVRLVAGERYMEIDVWSDEVDRDSRTATEQALSLAQAALAQEP